MSSKDFAARMPVAAFHALIQALLDAPAVRGPAFLGDVYSALAETLLLAGIEPDHPADREEHRAA